MAELNLDVLRDIMNTCSGAEDAGDISGEIGDVEFRELGYDSLAVLEIVSQVQRRFGVAVPDEAVERIQTPGQLLSFVNSSVAEV